MQMELLSIKASKDGHRLVLALKNRGWVKRKVLQQEMDLDDRSIRAEASASNGRVISGQKGYCLIEEAATAEVLHSASWLRHQAREMDDRASSIMRRYHDTQHLRIRK